MAMRVLRRRRVVEAVRGLLALVLVACLPVPAASQTTADIAVVVHPSVTVDSLTVAELRRILLGDREFWSAGARVTLLIRAPIARERDAVVRGVCQMSEAQFRQHWIGKVFRADTPSAPKIVYSNEMAIEQVSRTPGAITFVAGPVTNKSVKVLRIDGRLPGQQGYSLR
jgi:phosphate transport system substrate-binding protein